MIQISDRTRFFLVAFLTLASGLGLSASHHFPGILLDDQSFAADFVDTAPVFVVASLIGLLFADLKGLPPTLLLAGSQEVLLSDSTRLADRLRAAGVDTKLEVWPGMTHVWPSALEGIPEADLAIEHIATFISSRTGSPR